MREYIRSYIYIGEILISNLSYIFLDGAICLGGYSHGGYLS